MNFSLVKHFINNIIADIIDYLYGFIILVSSELDFRRGQTIPKEGDNPIRGGPKHPKSETTNQTDPKSRPKKRDQ